MPKTTYTHNYTYLITNTSNGMKYIGVRSCNCEIQDDRYMGSSKYLSKAINSSDDIFTKEVLLDFSNRADAINNEIFFHNHYHVGTNPQYYNKCKSSSAGFDTTGITSSSESVASRLATRKKNGTLNVSSAASIDKCLATKKKNGTLNVSSAGSIIKQMITKKKNGTMGNNWTTESISKSLTTRKRNGNWNPHTPESIAKLLASRKKNGNWYFQTTESIAKALATKRRNGTMDNNTPESIKKANKSRKITHKAKTEYFFGLCIYKAYYNC